MRIAQRAFTPRGKQGFSRAPTHNRIFLQPADHQISSSSSSSWTFRFYWSSFDGNTGSIVSSKTTKNAHNAASNHHVLSLWEKSWAYAWIGLLQNSPFEKSERHLLANHLYRFFNWQDVALMMVTLGHSFRGTGTCTSFLDRCDLSPSRNQEGLVDHLYYSFRGQDVFLDDFDGTINNHNIVNLKR